MLSKRDSNGAVQELPCVIKFTFSVSTGTSTGTGGCQMDEMGEAVNPEKAMEQMKSVPLPFGRAGGVMDGLNSAADQTSSRVDTWGPLLSKIEQFTKVVDKITEVRHAKHLTHHMMT
jgi:hypothetical protein